MSQLQHTLTSNRSTFQKNPSTLSLFNLNKFQKTTHFFLHFFGDFNAHCTKKKNYYILCCSEKANDDSETNRACIIIDDDMLASLTYYHLVDWHNLLIQAGNLWCSSLCNPVLVYISGKKANIFKRHHSNFIFEKNNHVLLVCI